MVPEVGERIGPYEILGRLGSGGMGLVYSAWDSRLHRDVAIKILREEYLSPTMRSRFLGEARAASRLNHPNICTIFDIGEHFSCPYLVMELLRGETLRGRMQNGGLSTDDILCVAEDVADALSVAHAQGIIHRDIKPANIVLVEKPGRRFQTKVLDFGLAKVDMGDELNSGLTSTGMTVGTVSYMSPEQARGELIDRRSDLFALGVVLYEMATGQLPFTGATSALVFVHLLNDPPEPVRNLNSAIPRSLEQVITTCLQKDRNARYQNAEEMVEAIRKVSQPGAAPEKERPSWLAKLAGGRKQTESNPANFPEPAQVAEEVPSEAPRSLVPADAMLRPVKRIRSSGRRTASASEPSIIPFVTPSSEAAAVASDIAREPTAPISSSHSFPQASVVPQLVLPPLFDQQPERSSSRLRKVAPFLGEEAAKEEHENNVHGASASSRSWRVLFGVLIVLFAACASYAVILARRAQPAALLSGSVMLTPITNHTGDNTLDGVVSAGLGLALQQSPYLALIGGADYAATMAANGVPEDGEVDAASAQLAARNAGAGTLVTGDVRVDGTAYSIVLRTVDSQTGRKLGEIVASAPDKSRIPATVDDLASKLRAQFGESAASIAHSSVPLGKSATASIDALHAFNSGENLEAGGSLINAMFAFERVAALDPQFTQANLHLVRIFLHQHAEVSASDAAARALASSATAGEPVSTLAKAANALAREQDYAKAITILQQMRSSYPHNIEALNMLALAQRLQGDFNGSLATSREVLRFAPRDKTAAASGELAFVALDQIGEAARAASSPALAGAMHTGTEITVNYLHAGNTDEQTSPDDLDAQDALASVLDAGGQLREGFIKWKETAAHASSVPELRSAAAYALAQGALDHALGADCAGALGLLQSSAGLPTGPTALFDMGAAAGLCNDTASTSKSIDALHAAYSQAFAVRSFYLTDLNALLLLRSGTYADALVSLGSADDYDSLSLTPYLRGLVYLSQRQPQLGTVEFQAVLRHRGAAMLVNPELYPAAQIAAARAYAANGDGGNAAQSYNRFLASWPHADTDNTLLMEARTGAMH